MPGPSESNGKEEIVVIGAGIIGVCTAYYLTQHPNFDPNKHHVTLLEARRPAGGASGKAGGLLALWAFPQQIVPLSFNLHKELADKYDGEEEWGYRRVNTMSVEADLTPQGPRKSLDTASLPESLDWIRTELLTDCNSLGGPDTTAQVHPYKFTNFLLKKAQESKGLDFIIGSVTRIFGSAEKGPDSVGGLEYVSGDRPAVRINASKVVLAAGPWTSKLLPECPISGLRAHSITIAPTRQVSAHALFTELRLSRHKLVSPEVYPRKDEVYVCGEGDTSVPVPESTDDVEVVREKCDDLFKYAAKVSPELEGGRLLRRQACYLPVVDVPSCSGPFMGETNVNGLFLASGHSCWGINNAPGTGKVMAELVLEGKARSARLTGLEPAAFFDVQLDEE